MVLFNKALFLLNPYDFIESTINFVFVALDFFEALGGRFLLSVSHFHLLLDDVDFLEVVVDSCFAKSQELLLIILFKIYIVLRI